MWWELYIRGAESHLPSGGGPRKRRTLLPAGDSRIQTRVTQLVSMLPRVCVLPWSLCAPLFEPSAPQSKSSVSVIFSDLAHSRCSADHPGMNKLRDPERGFAPSRTTVHSHIALHGLAKATFHRPVDTPVDTWIFK